MATMAAAAGGGAALTPDQEDVVLGHLADAAGPRAAGDVADALADQLRSILRAVGQYADARRRAAPFQETFPNVLAEVLARVGKVRGYRGRLAKLAALGSEAARPDTPPRPGPFYIADLRREIGSALASMPDRLADAARRIVDVKGRLAGGPNYGNQHANQHDPAWDAHCEAVAGLDGLKARSAALATFAAKVPSVQGPRVAAAIGAAGGAAKLAGALRDAALATKAHWGSDPEGAGLDAKARAVADLDDQLAQVDPAGPLGTALAADRKAAAAALEAAKAGADGRLKGGYARVLADAAAGDEPSRAGIEAAARAVPRAFPPAFADALMAAQFEYSPDGPESLATVAMLTRPAGPPAVR